MPGSGLCARNVRVLDRGPYDLEVASGEAVALTGRSGVGKSLLLRSLADLDPHTGSVELDGVDSARLPAPEWRRRVGLLPSESQWWGHTVGEHFPAGAPDHLESMGFGRDVLEWSTERLSSGERQRLALLRLLARSPHALLLDEPTANLDDESRSQVEVLVARYRVEQRIPVLWVTHFSDQIASVADRVLEMCKDGLRPLAPTQDAVTR